MVVTVATFFIVKNKTFVCGWCMRECRSSTEAFTRTEEDEEEKVHSATAGAVAATEEQKRGRRRRNGESNSYWSLPSSLLKGHK